jgi:hypothetical protein
MLFSISASKPLYTTEAGENQGKTGQNVVFQGVFRKQAF